MCCRYKFASKDFCISSDYILLCANCSFGILIYMRSSPHAFSVRDMFVFVSFVLLASCFVVVIFVQAQVLPDSTYLENQYLSAKGGMYVEGNSSEGLTVIDGKIGVGTTTPVSKVHIADSGDSFGLAEVPSDSGIHIGRDSVGQYGIELKAQTGLASDKAYIDFHGSSSLGGDYDARLINTISDTLELRDAHAAATNGVSVDGVATINGVSGVFAVTETLEALSNNGSIGQSLLTTSTGDEFCGLTRVRFEDVNDGSEYAVCDLLLTAGNWYVYAGTSGNADAACRAHCLRWD